MTTRYAVTIRCDDGRAPGCQIRLRYEYDHLRELDRGRVEAQAAGWWLGFRAEPEGGTVSFDLCPACAALDGPRRR